MSNKTDICLVCLRTDRDLKIINKKLTNFHQQLCDFTISAHSPLFCYECEYILKKTFKFRAKCLKAADILQKWKENMDQPVTLLCTLLPDCQLSTWSTDNKCIYTFNHEDLSVPTTCLPEISTEPKAVPVVVDLVGAENLLKNCQSKNIVKTETNEIQNDKEDSKALNLNDILILKTEDPTNTFEEILFKNNNVEKEKDYFNDTNDHLNDTNDVNDSFSEEDDDNLISLKNKYEKQKIFKRKLDKAIDESESKEKICKRKRNIAKKDKDSNKRVAKKNRDVEKDISKENNERDVAKENGGKEKKSRFHVGKDLIAELTNMSKPKQSDTKLCHKRLFSKERLKEEVTQKFSTCGELVSADGTIIDKQFILSCLDDRVTEFVMRQLYDALYRKSVIRPRAMRLFKCIQNKYKNEYDSIFNIEYLNTKEKMLEEFENRKHYESYLTAEYKCDICYQGFKHEKKLQYHMKCHDESAGNTVCSICKVRYKNMKSLINHMNTHSAVYKCKLCSLVTYYKCSMQNHFQQHKGVKFTCKQCNAVFGSVSAYRTHVSYRHARGHVCTICGLAYSTRVGLLAHVTRSHQNTAPAVESGSVKCDQCSLTFASDEAYHKHLRVTHKQASRGRPAGSLMIRSDGKPRKRPAITCRVCNKVGSSWGWMSLHFSLEHPNVDLERLYSDKHTYLCDVCGKSFSTIYTLQAHLNVHSGARPYACDSCDARFHRSLSLRLHQLVHTPPSKPCPTCGKKFRSTSNLYNHIRSHIGDRRYKCDICGKGFLHRCSLNEHVRGVHNNIRRVRKRGVTDIEEGH